MFLSENKDFTGNGQTSASTLEMDDLAQKEDNLSITIMRIFYALIIFKITMYVHLQYWK